MSGRHYICDYPSVLIYEKNNCVAIAVNADCRPRKLKKSEISAHKPSANTAETSGRNAVPALPCHFRRSSCLAMIKAQQYAEPFVTFDDSALRAQNYRSFSSFLFFTLRGCARYQLIDEQCVRLRLKLNWRKTSPAINESVNCRA